VAFLTDERAVSYAETLLAIVRGHGLADIVGEPTAGMNGNINPFSLPGGHRIVWTGMKVVNHDGSALAGHGVQPTEPVTATIAGVRQGRDEVLERAIEVVTQPGRR
jgi:C-terminal processing protease CtpA/Prc